MSRPPCSRCGEFRDVFTHSEWCDDDLCSLNGDAHSCAGRVVPCPWCARPFERWIRAVSHRVYSWKSVVCILTDHRYGFPDGPSGPWRCRLCGDDGYYPARWTLGRVLEELRYRREAKKRAEDGGDKIPF